MEPAFSCVTGYSVAILLQMVVLPSEQFTVSSSRSHQVALEGGCAELSCQLSPPECRAHADGQPVYLYKDGEEVSGKSTYNNVNRTVFLKDTLGEGKVTLRIRNISVLDGGQYYCFFKDDILFKSKCAGMLCENLCLPIYLIILLALSCFRIKCILLRKVSQNRWFVLFSYCIRFIIHADISPVYLKFKIGVSDSDALFPLYSTWIRDICVILTVLMIFSPVFISCLLQTLEGKALFDISMELFLHEAYNMVMKAHIQGGAAYNPDHEQSPCKSHMSAKRKSRFNSIRPRATKAESFHTLLNASVPNPN